MQIDYDPAKRDLTLMARGLDMAEVAEAFLTEIVTLDDDRRDYGEDRFMTVGSMSGRMVVVIWTWRGASRRIISLRKANEREQKAYRPPL